MSLKSRGGPLEGVRVLELTKVWAGPAVGKMFAYLGAEVIRIESEGSLDVTRTFGVDDINNAPGWQSVNPQKLSAQVNMKSEEGIELILDLAKHCDILVENLRPGAISRLGLGYERVREANPGIVYVSMGMWGSEGPLAYQTGYAPCFAALGGVSALVGHEPGSPAGMNTRYSDSSFGASASYAAMVALFHKRRTGVGQFVDVSAVECISTMIGDSIMDYALNGVVQDCVGNHHPEMSPHGVYPARNEEWVSIAVRSDAQWASLAECLGQPGLADDSRFRTLAGRKANEVELDRLVQEWTAGLNAMDVVAKLQKRGIAAAKSQSSLDLIADPHLWMRGFYRDVTDHAGRSKPTLGPSWEMSRAAEASDAAPALGQHNDYVFGEILGLSAEERERLQAAGITR